MAQHSYQYFTSKGKPFYSDKKLSDDELDELLSELETEEVPEPIIEPVVEESIIEEPEPVIEEEEPSMLRKAYNWAATPTVDIRGSFSPEMQQGMELFSEEHPNIGGGLNFGIDVLSGASSPLSLATAGAGALTRLAGKLPQIARTGARTIGGVTAASGGERIINAKSPQEAAFGLGELGIGLLGARGPKIKAGKPIPKPDDLFSPDELMPDKITPKSPVTQEFMPDIKTPVSKPVPSTKPILPRDLAGAKPRYNLAGEVYEPIFDNDLDKALYIIAQKTPSKRDSDYLAFVMEHTGLDKAGARQAGLDTRAKIAAIIKKSEPGEVQLPTLYGQAGKAAKPRLRIERDGTFTNLDTGEVVQPGQKIPPSETVEIPPPPVKPPKPPKDFEGKPEDLPKVDVRRTNLQEAINLPRAIQSAYDLSFPFRQGLGLIHTKGWWTSWNSMIKSYGSENSFRGVIDSILERPNYLSVKDASGKVQKSLAERAGLALTDLTELSKREEAIMSTWAEKIPGIRASNRAYTAFANKLRADNFDSLILQAEKMGLDPKNNDVLSKQIASYVNNASGRGSLGSLEKAAVELNGFFFSPRLIASRLQMMNPKNYIFSEPMVRKQYLKSMMAMAGTWTTMASLAKIAGAEVSLDLNSADFGKIKIGDTRLDPAGGFQQYLVLLSRMASGKYTTSTTGKEHKFGEKFGSKTRLDTLADFIQNKLAPVPSYGARAAEATSYRPFQVGDETVRMFTPIILQDLIELIQEDPDLIPLALPATAIGIGSQTYGRNKPKPLIIPPEFDFQIPQR